MPYPGRPAWYRTARTIGGMPWVPFEVASALQQRLDAFAERLELTERELARVRKLAGGAEAQVEAAQQQAERFKAEAEAARQDAAAAAERLAECEVEEKDESARVAELVADLDNVRRHRDGEIARARLQERVQGLLALAEVHDDLLRSLQSNPDTESPWYAGHAAILSRVRAELEKRGAVALGAAGEAFDPQLHEAIAYTPSPQPEGTVIDVVEVGFRLEEGVLVRPARVVVSAG